MLPPPVDGASPVGLIAARGEVAPTITGRYRVRLITSIRGEIGERVLDAESCAAASHAAALMVVVALDSSSHATPPTTVIPTAEVQQTPPASPPHVRPRVSMGGAVFVSGTGSLGLVPGFGPGVGLGGALRFGHARVELGANYWPATRQQFSMSQIGVDVSLATLALRGCGFGTWNRFEIGGCGALEGGILSGTGTGVASPTTSVQPWLGASISARFAWVPLPGLAVAVDLGPGLTLYGETFQIDATNVFTTSLFYARATASIELRF